jgi:putative heme iron utilization protein
VIKIKKSHRGLLHAALGVPQGEKIPLSAIAKAKKSKSPAMRKRATFAMNARSFRHGA